MKNIRKHLQDSYNDADREYWDIKYLYDTRSNQLAALKQEVDGLFASLQKFDVERKYYENLLNELNDTENGKDKIN